MYYYAAIVLPKADVGSNKKYYGGQSTIIS